MKVSYSKSAEKEILALEKIIAQKIAEKIATLGTNPFLAGYQKLSGREGYRIRIGDYRVVYKINKLLKEVTIIKVQHRREVYR